MTQGDVQKVEEGVGVLEYRQREVSTAWKWAGRLLIICGAGTIGESLITIAQMLPDYRMMVARGDMVFFWSVIAGGVVMGVWGGVFLLLRGPCRRRRWWAIICSVLMALAQGGLYGNFLCESVSELFRYVLSSTTKIPLWLRMERVGMTCFRVVLLVALVGVVVSLLWPGQKR